MSDKILAAENLKEEAEPKSRSFVAPDKDRMSVILEAVRTSLNGLEAAAFRDKNKQNSYLEHVMAGLEVFAGKDPAVRNIVADRFAAIKKHLDGLNGVLGALTPVERVLLDVAAEKVFNAARLSAEDVANAMLSSARYGRTGGASMLGRVDGVADDRITWNSSFVVDGFQADCALLTKAIKPIVASHQVKTPAKEYHLEENVEELIGFLGRAWRDIFDEKPSWNPNARFGKVLRAIFDQIGVREAGVRTLKRILQP